MFGSNWEDLHAVWCRHSTEASLSIRIPHSDPCRFILIWYTVYLVQKNVSSMKTLHMCVCAYVCPSGCDPTQIWKQLILVLVMVALMHRIDFKKKRRRKNITVHLAPVNKCITNVSNKTGFVKVQLPWQRTNTLKLGNTFLHWVVCTVIFLFLCSLVLTAAVCL